MMEGTRYTGQDVSNSVVQMPSSMLHKEGSKDMNGVMDNDKWQDQGAGSLDEAKELAGEKERG